MATELNLDAYEAELTRLQLAEDIGTGTKNVSAKDKSKLAPLMKHYLSQPKPFTACVADQVKHGLSDDHAKKRCAVLLDASGAPWRKTSHHSFDPSVLDGVDLSQPVDLEAYETALETQRMNGLALTQARLNLAVFHFDPDEHPRDLLGRFAEKLGSMKNGGKIQLPDGVTVTKDKDKYRVGVGNAKTSASYTKPESAAMKALDISATNTHPDSLGGDISYNQHDEVVTQDDLDALADSSTKDLIHTAKEGEPEALRQHAVDLLIEGEVDDKDLEEAGVDPKDIYGDPEEPQAPTISPDSEHPSPVAGSSHSGTLPANASRATALEAVESLHPGEHLLVEDVDPQPEEPGEPTEWSINYLEDGTYKTNDAHGTVISQWDTPEEVINDEMIGFPEGEPGFDTPGDLEGHKVTRNPSNLKDGDQIHYYGESDGTEKRGVVKVDEEGRYHAQFGDETTPLQDMDWKQIYKYDNPPAEGQNPDSVPEETSTHSVGDVIKPIDPEHGSNPHVVTKVHDDGKIDIVTSGPRGSESEHRAGEKPEGWQPDDRTPPDFVSAHADEILNEAGLGEHETPAEIENSIITNFPKAEDVKASETEGYPGVGPTGEIDHIALPDWHWTSDGYEYYLTWVEGGDEDEPPQWSVGKEKGDEEWFTEGDTVVEAMERAAAEDWEGLPGED